MIRADDAKAGSTVFKINRSCSASKMNEMWQSTGKKNKRINMYIGGK